MFSPNQPLQQTLFHQPNLRPPWFSSFGILHFRVFSRILATRATGNSRPFLFFDRLAQPQSEAGPR